VIVDLFAGGGGASEGIRLALGRDPDVAINHNAAALAVHRANHPGTRHYIENVWRVSPKKATGGRPVSLLWLSPDCRHFSKAKGSAPLDKGVRGLAWAAVRWARETAPETIVLENVAEFQSWGPLLDSGRPDPTRAGQTFKRWRADLRRLGYSIEHRELVAADFGAPTTRRRFFLVARRAGTPTWAAPSHGAGLTPHRTAAEIIDWTVSGRSIFGRARPHVAATLQRIAVGGAARSWMSGP
jgi:DNA (cytosine-5)-methyltransferase 1